MSKKFASISGASQQTMTVVDGMHDTMCTTKKNILGDPVFALITYDRALVRKELLRALILIFWRYYNNSMSFACMLKGLQGTQSKLVLLCIYIYI